VGKTMRFLAEQIEQTFPDRPILPALGNNDEVCGDFWLQPEGPFLADMLPVFRELVGANRNPGFDGDWTSYGNYSVAHPGLRGVRVISANTVFFSPRYRNACGSPDGADPGRATLAWLEAELAAAKRAQEHVWLLYHVPPGVDAFATLVRGSCPDTILPMWDDAYAEPFYALLRRYADTVIASFAGHTHMDDFRLVGDDSGYYAFTLITPALSAIFGQNPAFRTVAYDSAGGLLDQTTCDLTNLPDATATVPATWQAEYTFTQEWHLLRVDLASLERLYEMIQDVPEARERWHALFPVSSPVYWSHSSGGGERQAQAVRAYHCASGHVLLSEYRQCYCRGSGK
jgi:sphingomyelin phosphodiesterase acid-like 3